MEIFPAYEMETGNRKFFRFTKWKLEILRFPFRKTEIFRFPYIPELSRNSGLRNKFPDHSISKMEIFFRKNGNPTNEALKNKSDFDLIWFDLIRFVRQVFTKLHIFSVSYNKLKEVMMDLSRNGVEVAQGDAQQVLSGFLDSFSLPQFNHRFSRHISY